MSARIYGPVVPSSNPAEDVVSAENDNETALKSDESYGPALPPHLLSRSLAAVPDEAVEPNQNFYGPTLPNTTNSQQKKLEERALEIKLRNCNQSITSNEQPIREEWMIELPSIVSKTSLGLTARTFKTKEGPDFSDRSSWTKNPNESESSKSSKTTFEIKDSFTKERDKEQEQIAKKLKKKHKREKSLLELHEKKRKKEKKKKKEKDREERRPFSRDTDLQVNRFDDAKKKALIKKAQLLDTRFSSGKEAKYL